MRSEEQRLRAELVRAGQLMYERGLTVAMDGNLSARLGDDLILTTPAGACKGMVAAEELVLVDLDGVGRGPGRASTELPLHLHVYRRRPDVRAVVHAHPPHAIACMLAGISLEQPLLPEIILTMGKVPTAPYAQTGTAAMGTAIDGLIEHHDGLLLERHGTLAVGSTPLEALLRTEQIEQVAKIILLARQHAPLTPLSAEALQPLLEVRRARGGSRESEPPSP